MGPPAWPPPTSTATAIATLVVANEGDGSSPGSMTVLRGNGDGTFTLVQQDDPNDPGMTVDSLPAELGTRAVAHRQHR